MAQTPIELCSCRSDHLAPLYLGEIYFFKILLKRKLSVTLFLSAPNSWSVSYEIWIWYLSSKIVALYLQYIYSRPLEVYLTNVSDLDLCNIIFCLGWYVIKMIFLMCDPASKYLGQKAQYRFGQRMPIAYVGLELARSLR